MNYWLHHKIPILWLILFFCLKPPVQGQEQSFVEFKGEPEYTLTSGEEQDISLSFLIKEGYHIQADQVKNENLIPSALSFEPSDGLILGDPVFPQTVEFRMKGVEKALDVYSDLLEINVPVRTEKSKEKEQFLIKGKLHYQACDASKCYFPRDLPFIMKIIME